MLTYRLPRLAGLALGSMFLLFGCSRVHLGTHDGGGDQDAGPGSRVQCGATLCEVGDVCCNESCGICSAPDLACPAIFCPPGDCFSDAECAPSEYCNWPDGSCATDGPGVCTPLPEACTPVIRATCGCDGRTYSSPCDAAAQRVSVLHDGACDAECAPQDAIGEGPCDASFGVRWNGSACEDVSGCSCAGVDCDALYMDFDSCQTAHASCTAGGSCVANADCAPGSYCHFAIGECTGSGDGLGQCRRIPGEIACPFDAPPVCGCDGRTYDCDATAHQVGVSVLHSGACSDACSPMDAAGDGDCAAFFGYRWNGSTCEGVGGCSCIGTDCDALYASDAECLRAFEGCERMPGGACGGFVGYVCRPDEWCDFADPHYCGGADESGVCRPRPAVCTGLLEPACGCDGTTYDNACVANASGWDTWSDPSSGCGAPPP